MKPPALGALGPPQPSLAGLRRVSLASPRSPPPPSSSRFPRQIISASTSQVFALVPSPAWGVFRPRLCCVATPGTAEGPRHPVGSGCGDPAPRGWAEQQPLCLHRPSSPGTQGHPGAPASVSPAGSSGQVSLAHPHRGGRGWSAAVCDVSRRPGDPCPALPGNQRVLDPLESLGVTDREDEGEREGCEGPHGRFGG